jgi:hypothetical protein
LMEPKTTLNTEAKLTIHCKFVFLSFLYKYEICNSALKSDYN